MTQKKFNILVLDGGGSKGVYTIGVLKELEKKLGGKLYQHFDLIYGTSTGSIIASLIALGEDVSTIERLYLELIPKIMKGASKSKNLKVEADKIFEDQKFDSFKTNIGIVATNFDNQKPLIFKSNINLSHGMKHSFEPGFGCSISDAIQASCAAYPIFDVKRITTENQGALDTVDGGFIANNATLFALIDAHKGITIEAEDIQVLSIGVGRFIEKPINWKLQFMGRLKMVKFIEKVLSANANTNEILPKLLFPSLNLIRINETFNQPEYGTNMIETNKNKLEKLIQLGRSSFAKFEKEIDQLFLSEVYS